MPTHTASCSCGQLSAITSADPVRVGDAGSRILFNFCPTCGATVHYPIEGSEERMHSWVQMPKDIQHMV
jgi:hypothetical protein